jgi:hypothetical protein
MTLTSWKTKLLALACVLALALMVAACGDDDDLTPNLTATPASTADDGGDDGGDDDPTATDEGDDGDDDGGDEETPNFEEQGDLLNACELITKDEVEATLGGPSEEPDPSYIGEFSDCSWEGLDFSYSVSISVLQSGREAAELLYGLGAEDYEEVDGLGEEAQWSDGFLDVLEGDYNISMTIFIFSSDIDDTQKLEQAKALAAKALDRLP